MTLVLPSFQVEESIESVVEQLRRSPSQRALSRAIYDQEYKQSILDCMQTSEGPAASFSCLLLPPPSTSCLGFLTPHSCRLLPPPVILMLRQR